MIVLFSFTCEFLWGVQNVRRDASPPSLCNMVKSRRKQANNKYKLIDGNKKRSLTFRAAADCDTQALFQGWCFQSCEVSLADILNINVNIKMINFLLNINILK